MSATDWLVTIVAGAVGFFLNEYLRDTLHARGHAHLSAGVAVLVSASLFGFVVLTYVAVTR